MFSQYFGQYLFNEGVLTAEQLYNIFQYKGNIEVKLGTMAMTSGLMTAAQVEEVLSIQQMVDRKFGEIAIEKGYLTAIQVDQLLNSQKNSQVNLSQAIVDRGYLSLSEIEKQLENFYNQQSSTSLGPAQIKAIEANDVDAIVRMFLYFASGSDTAKWYYEYVSFCLRNAIRFFDENAAIYRMSQGREHFSRLRSKQMTFWLFSQDIPGEINLKASIMMDDATLLEIAGRIGEKIRKDISVNDSPADIIAKYFNILNNIFIASVASNLTDKNAKIKLPPPEVLKQKAMFESEGFRIPTVYSFGQIDILLESLERSE